ncbi:MAG: ABC transporter substrate-binding protein [Mycobacterium sp.]
MHTRRAFLGLAGAAALAAGCSRNGTAGDSNGKAVISHIFGETTVPGPPRRVVSAGLTEQDDLLAVGVVPVAVTNWFGDQPSGVWPWAQPKLGAAKPALLNLDNGIQVDQIATLKPDLIVAVNAGLDADTYQKLSAIAPTIAQSGGDAFFEPWKDQARSIARAVFKTDQMAQLIDAVEARFSSAGQANTAFKDRTAVLLSGAFSGDTVTATVAGWRTDFLTAMGFRTPENLKNLAGSDGNATIGRTDLAAGLQGADVLIWTTESDAAQAALLADPAVAALRATSLKHNVFTGGDLAGAIAFASPLSYPVVAAQLPAMLARALS